MTATIAVAGISHLRTTTRCAGTSGRDSLHLAPEDAVALARSLAAGGREAAVLVTCRRTEVYLSGVDDAEETARRALTELGAPALASPSVYSHDGEEAARHLFRVAAGLESIVPGDPHVTAQVRQAHQMARDAWNDRAVAGPPLRGGVRDVQTYPLPHLDFLRGHLYTGRRHRPRRPHGRTVGAAPLTDRRRREDRPGGCSLRLVARLSGYHRGQPDRRAGREAGQPRRRAGRGARPAAYRSSPQLTSLSPPPPAAASSSPRNISTVPGRSSSSIWPSPLTCTPPSRWSVDWSISTVWPGSYRRAPSTGGPISSGPP